MFDEQVMLLKAVHQYYPVGNMKLKSYFHGYKTIAELVKEKIREIEENKSVSTIIEKELQNSFKEISIINCNYFQFPSFHFNLKIESEDFNKKLVRRRSCILSISGLIEGFTIYFKDEYLIKNQEEFISRHVIDSNSEVLTETINLKILFEGISKILIKYFPQKQLMDHFLLKTLKVGGVYPFNIDGENENVLPEYSIYELLFLGEADDFDTLLR